MPHDSSGPVLASVGTPRRHGVDPVPPNVLAGHAGHHPKVVAWAPVA